MGTTSRNTGSRDKIGLIDDFGLSGIEFIEFAAFGKKNAADLLAKLEVFGFQVVARHRSKDTTLLRQGDINLIINCEPDSFARSFAVRFGTSVCAIALRVADAGRIHHSALHSGVRDYRGRIGPNESVIPAVRAISGSLLYLVEQGPDNAHTIYQRDFADLRPVEPFDGNLARIDHISQSVYPGMTRKWIRFYRRVLGLHVIERNTITDPNGRALSSVLSDEGRHVHFILNEPNNLGTDCDRFLRDNCGEGVQHIAFETPDLFAYLDHIRERGVEILKIPDFYYDNLLAEGYDSVLVNKLRAYHVMIDTENGGQFLHAYSLAFAENLFFEFVQRTQHQGFGRHDVSARLKAQMREGAAAPATKTDSAQAVTTDILEFSIDAETILLGTLASASTHIRMPELMSRDLAMHGLNMVWLPFIVESDGLAAFIAAVHAMQNLTGFSVAAPHKAAIVPYLDELSPRANAIGAANLVRKDASNRLIGDIVDGECFVRNLKEVRGAVAGTHIWLFGATVEGRAIAYALAEADVGHLSVTDPDETKARKLVDDIRRVFPQFAASLGKPHDIGRLDIAINASTLGSRPEDPMPFNPAEFSLGTWVADVVTRPEVTRLLFEAQKHGLDTCSGSMPLAKQVDSYADFFGFSDMALL